MHTTSPNKCTSCGRGRCVRLVPTTSPGFCLESRDVVCRLPYLCNILYRVVVDRVAIKPTACLAELVLSAYLGVPCRYCGVDMYAPDHCNYYMSRKMGRSVWGMRLGIGYNIYLLTGIGCTCIGYARIRASRCVYAYGSDARATNDQLSTWWISVLYVEENQCFARGELPCRRRQM